MSGTGRRRGGSFKDKNRKKSFDSFLDRTLYISVNLIGQQVEVQINDGSWYEGLLHTVTTNKGFGVVLHYARKKSTDSNNDTPYIDKITIPPSEFVQIVATDAVFVEDISDSGGAGFLTDTAISRSGDLKERELQPWKPDDSVPAPSLSGSATEWDQFSENERLFGVTTSYNEDLYTTQLDKNSQFYRQRESEAARLAQEISHEPTTHVQVAVERGLAVEVDEEDLYGSVARKGSSGKVTPGKYIPPGRRALLGQSGDQTEPAAEQETPQTQTPATEQASPVSAPEKPASPVPAVSEPQTPASEVSSSPTTVQEKPADSPKAKPAPAKSSFVFRAERPTAIDTNKHINDLYCSLMNRVNWTDPLKVSPFWGGKGSWKYVEEEVSPYYQGFPPVPYPVMYPSAIPMFQPAFVQFPAGYPVPPQKHFFVPPPPAKIPPAPYGAPMYSYDVEYPYPTEPRYE